jgi:hypothetical protein
VSRRAFPIGVPSEPPRSRVSLLEGAGAHGRRSLSGKDLPDTDMCTASSLAASLAADIGAPRRPVLSAISGRALMRRAVLASAGQRFAGCAAAGGRNAVGRVERPRAPVESIVVGRTRIDEHDEKRSAFTRPAWRRRWGAYLCRGAKPARPGRSEFVGCQTGPLRDAGEHARPNLLVIVKCKHDVWPVVATEGPMRTGYAFDLPADSQ